MKKLLTLCTTLLLVFVTAITMTGCGNKVKLDVKKVELLAGETYALSIESKLPTTCSSSNEDVAIVDEFGVITAVKSGTATITVANEKRKAECKVKVSDVIAFSVPVTACSIYPGSKYQVVAYGMANNLQIEDGVYSYSSSNEDVITVDDNGLVTAVGRGSATVTIEWEYDGQTFSGTIDITVSDNVQIILKKQADVLYAFGDESRSYSFVDNGLELFVNHEKVENPTFTWSVENEDVAQVSGGVVEGKSYGKTIVTAKYTYEGIEYSSSAEVYVSRVYKAREEGVNEYSFGYKTDDLVLDSANFDGDIQEIFFKYRKIDFSIDQSGNVVVSKENFDRIEDVELDVYTEYVETTALLEVYTATIDSKSDLDMMDEWGRPLKFDNRKPVGTEGTLYNYTGIYHLAADIDYGGDVYDTETKVGFNGCTFGYANNAGAQWLNVEFYGHGHQIKNLKINSQFGGLFGRYLLGNSIVKDVAFTNVSLGGIYGSTIAGNLGGASRIENVFVSGSVDPNVVSTNNGFIVSSISNNGTAITNCLVNMTKEVGLKYAGICDGVSGDSLASQITNSYTIGSNNHVTFGGLTAKNWTGNGFIKGGYAEPCDFIADKEKIFMGAFGNVYSYEQLAEGMVIKFYGKEVARISGATEYFGLKNGKELAFSKSEFDGEVTDLNVEYSTETDRYVIDTTDLKRGDKFELIITAGDKEYRKTVKVVTATISNKDDYLKMGEWAETEVINGRNQTVGSFVLLNDIDFGGMSLNTANRGVDPLWHNLAFDGLGHKLSNVNVSGVSLLANRIYGGKVENFAVTNVSLDSYARVVSLIFDGAILENVFVSGAMNSVTSSTLLVDWLTLNSAVNNVLVENVGSISIDTGCVSMIGRVMKDTSNVDEANHKIGNPAPYDTTLNYVNNAYSIGAPSRHLVTGFDVYNGVFDYKTMTEGGGYADDDSFIEDISKIDLGPMMEVENIGGVNVLKFGGKVVKVFVDGTADFSAGMKDGTNVELSSEEFGNVSSVKLDLTEELSVVQQGDKYVVDAATSFSKSGKFGLLIENSVGDKFYRTVRVADAFIKSAEEFNKMYTEYSGSTGVGTFVLANDINFANTAPANTNVHWSNINFDGQGYVIRNISCRLFGLAVHKGSIKNLAIIGANIPDSNSVICDIFRGTLQNIYVSGLHNSTGWRSSLLVDSVDGAGKISNVLVENVGVDPAELREDSKSYMLARVINASANDQVYYFENAYSIGGATRHVVCGANDATKFDSMTKVSGGYADNASFLADYNSFDKSFKDVFEVAEMNGGKVLKFLGQIVKTYSYTATKTYDAGYYKGDLVLDKNDFNGTANEITINGNNLVEFSTDVNGNYVVANTNFNGVGTYLVTVKTDRAEYLRKVNVVTSFIYDAQDLNNMFTWGEIKGNQMYHNGSFILAKDIDYGGNLYNADDATDSWANLEFDGRGHIISNISFGNAALFGNIVQKGFIKNLGITNANIGNWQRALCGDLEGGTIENVFVSATVTGSNNSSILVNKVKGTGVIKNVVVINNGSVNLNSSTTTSMIAKNTRATSASDTDSGIINAYSIGCADRHVVTSSGYTMTNIKGGYNDFTTFVNDKETIFADSSFASVFSVDTVEGVNVLKFFDKIVAM